MKTEQHYRLTLNQAIDHYQSGDLTAKGALRIYFLIRLKPGWECRVKPKELQELFGMKRSTFWAAMNSLVEEGFLNDWQENQTVTVSLSCQNSGQPSKILDSHPENETPILNSGQPSNEIDNQTPEPLPVEDSETPSDSFQIPDQISINSLSVTPVQKFLDSLPERERDDFLNFCKTQTANYRKPIVNLADYLASQDATGTPRYQLFYNKFKAPIFTATSQSLNTPAVETVDERVGFINRLKASWGLSKFRNLITAVVDGWVYFCKLDPQPLSDLLQLSPQEIEAIALGGI